ncbi:hypothetical protein ACWGH3_16735 [Streptomyces sp. NPDC054884]|uniref:hypothetical protein n=1 Tax=Streptomyces sp. ME08-AFT2 TaxID=3028683 RepID=UPI0029AF621C|nr:hypothetical protein [Streptomyces sp. ME08-AFT2]MDX3314364.1 hypothetical protein [Streptomyces sp. ME08-AFT2]
MAGKRVGPVEEDGVEHVLDALYATPPSDFVSRREQEALAARSDGRAADARRIRAARRPTPAAWAANLLLRAQPQECRRLLELGRALREAYRTLDADGVKELSEQRRGIVSALSRQAAELAHEAGHRLSDAARQDFDATLRAVLADQDAADRWAAGRLESALTPPTDFPARSADTAAGGRTERARVEAPRPSSHARQKDELAERRRRREEQLDAARRAAEEAGRLLHDLSAARADAASALQQARDRHDQAARRRATAEEELRRADEELARADRERQEAEEALRAAGDAVKRAERTARDAEKEAARLAGPNS